MAFVLILMICCLLCFGGWYWSKQREPVAVYEPKAVPSISMFSKQSMHSMQDLELQSLPRPAYIDENVAGMHADNDEEEKHESPMDGHVADGQLPRITSMASTASDPKINPNLKSVDAFSVVAGSGDTLKRTNGGTSPQSEGGDGSDGGDGGDEADGDGHGDGNELAMGKERDRALDLIAGNSISVGYENMQNNSDDEDDDDDADEESELLYDNAQRKTTKHKQDGNENGNENENEVFSV